MTRILDEIIFLFQLLCDYKKLLELWKTQKLILNDSHFYINAFLSKWPGVAKSLVKLVKTSDKAKYHKIFEDNKELLQSGMNIEFL